jgi:hypothetical protein
MPQGLLRYQVTRLKAVLPMMFIPIVVPTLMLMLRFGFNKMSELFCKKEMDIADVG